MVGLDLPHCPLPLTPDLFCEFFDQVAEFGKDEFFHREPNGVFGAGGGEEDPAFDDACSGAAHDGR